MIHSPQISINPEERAGFALYLILCFGSIALGFTLPWLMEGLWGRVAGAVTLTVGVVLAWWLGPFTKRLDRLGNAMVDALTPTSEERALARKEALEAKIQKDTDREPGATREL